MKKRFFALILLLVALIPFKLNYMSAKAQSESVILGGMPAGFSLYTRGAHIVGICDVMTKNGIVSPSKDAGLCAGDIILSIEENEVNSAQDIANAIKDGKNKRIKIKRIHAELDCEIVPAIDCNGQYKLGVFIRDNVNGIGTVTYIKNGVYATLGHPVIDSDGSILQIKSGAMYGCNITGYVKGQKGKPGELRGVFMKNQKFADINKNLDCGVFGVSNQINPKKAKKIELGNAKMGNATIYTTINGSAPKEYSIQIVKTDYNVKDNRNFVIRITDEELLNTTGGIVQGMSGSPIVQNGKLVGAVTHVFINDPTRGFGISIDNMLES